MPSELDSETPPLGSCLRIEYDCDGVERILLPYPQNLRPRMLLSTASLFFLLLFGWIWFFTLEEFRTSRFPSSLVLGIGLVAWIVGMGVPCFLLYLALRRSVPESITVLRSGVVHDTGVAPVHGAGRDTRAHEDQTIQMVRRRTRTEFNARQTATLALVEQHGGN